MATAPKASEDRMNPEELFTRIDEFLDSLPEAKRGKVIREYIAYLESQANTASAKLKFLLALEYAQQAND